jgi:hypothetical protein
MRERAELARQQIRRDRAATIGERGCVSPSRNFISATGYPAQPGRRRKERRRNAPQRNFAGPIGRLLD